LSSRVVSKGASGWLKRTHFLVSLLALRYDMGIGVARIKTLKT